MNALELNRYSDAWRAFGAAVPRPRAILVVSAHWYINATAVSAMVRPRTIHDFYGFPHALFDIEYPAPWLPELAEQIADIVHLMWVGRDLDSWGIDHGTWSLLVHAFPDASIPVVQLSLNAEKDQNSHLTLGQKLAALRREGVLIVGSGNIVHNLRALDFSRPDSAYDWAQRFDDHAREPLLSQEPSGVTSLDADRDFPLAVPTPDHFLPLLYLAGIAADGGQDITALVDGHAAGSISMASYTLGIDCPAIGEVDDKPAAALPTSLPTDETNLRPISGDHGHKFVADWFDPSHSSNVAPQASHVRGSSAPLRRPHSLQTRFAQHAGSPPSSDRRLSMALGCMSVIATSLVRWSFAASFAAADGEADAAPVRRRG